MDDRRLRDSGDEGGVRGIGDGKFPKSGRHHAAQGRARLVSAWRSTSSAKDMRGPGIIKDAGDDPDVTHGAMIVAKVRRAGDRA